MSGGYGAAAPKRPWVVVVAAALCVLAAAVYFGSRVLPSTGSSAGGPTLPSGVSGGKWHLQQVRSATGAVTDVHTGQAFIRFTDAGSTDGNDGCATFGALRRPSGSSWVLKDVSAAANGCVAGLDHVLDVSRAAMSRLLTGQVFRLERNGDLLQLITTTDTLTFSR